MHQATDAEALDLHEALAWLPYVAPLPTATVAWILDEARRCVVPEGVVLATWNPGWARVDLIHEVRSLDDRIADESGWRPIDERPADRVTLLRSQGLLDERFTVVRPVDTVLEAVASDDVPPSSARGSAQHRVHEWVLRHGPVASAAEAARGAGVSASTVRTAMGRGLLRYVRRTRPPPPPPAPLVAPGTPRARRAALDVRIVRPDASGDDGSTVPALVEGGDPEGRLEVLEGVGRTKTRGPGAVLVVVPTRAHLGATASGVASWGPTFVLDGDHDGERREAWDAAVASTDGAVVVGTWPVLLAPARWSWIVVVDGDHEAYKLRSGPRSWIPESVEALAAKHGCPTTHTTAWPGPEAAARHPQRAWWRLDRPRVRWWISDLSATRSWPLGDEAIRTLRQVASRDRQAIVVAPGKAFSGALGCRDCGTLVMCPHCDVALRWHAGARRLRCHHCGHDGAPPRACASCQGSDLIARKSAGVEWVLSAIERAVPGLARYRFDGDVQDDLTPLLEGAPGVVVGTQSVISLPRLPATSLVVVSHVDVALGADDFRAVERVVRTLTSLERQAGSRAPLGLVQTFSPGNETLAAIAAPDAHGLDALRDDMRQRRKRFGYPPFGVLARIQLSARTRESAWSAAEEIRSRLRLVPGTGDDDILGPADAKIARVRDRRIVHLIVRTQSDHRRSALLASGALSGHKGVQVRVDVDPRDIGEVLI